MRLYVLDYGSLDLALDVLVPGDGGGERITVGVPGYLIRTDDGRTVLVDSGLPPAYLDDPVAAARGDRFGGWLWGARLKPENHPAAQLARLGLAPADVTDLVVTHTHFDHAGGLGDFPNATLVVHRAERERPPAYSRFAWPAGARYRILDGDADLAPGVRLLHTPGHTPGHLSLLLSLPATGPTLLAIDALYHPLVPKRDNFKASTDEAAAGRSGSRLLALAEERGAWLIYGHDPNQWAALRKAPAFYD